MATTTTLMFTALPNGGPDPYRISLFVSPRLEGAGPTGLLGDYTLGNWPGKLRALLGGPTPLQIELGFAGGPRVPIKIQAPYLADLDEKLWEAIFPLDSTRVAPRQFQDLSRRWLRSYQVRSTEAFIQGLYNTVADQYPGTFPDLKAATPVTRFTDAFGRALALVDAAGQKPFFPPARPHNRPKTYDPYNGRGRATHPDAGVEASLTALASTLGVADIPLAELFRGYRFFKRGNQSPYRSKDEPWDPSIIQDRPAPPRFDFHKTVAALGDHPFLLRKLGLVIDGELEGVRPLLGQFPQLQAVIPALAGIATLTPWTQHQLSLVSGFRPRPRQGGDLRDGMLRLDNKDAFDVIQSDPDGNLIKVFDYAANMDRYRKQLLGEKGANPNARMSQAPEETSLPALRSGGIMVVRNKRDDQVWDKLSLQAGYETSPDNAVLFADDLLRGYRIDVLYKGSWYSLCRWRGRYEVGGAVIDRPGPEEGYIKSDSASSDDAPVVGPQPPDLYLHETLFGWRNWSLVTEVPGKTIVPQPQPDKHQLEKVEARRNQPGPDVNFAWNSRAERGSLPPLRYGESYQLRARAVDLAGNSLAPPPSKSDPAPGGDAVPGGFPTSPPLRYLRYDPIPAPMVLLAAKVTEGESMGVSVIRSRGDAAPQPLPPVLMLDEAQLFNPSNVRWFAAPKTTVGEAEAHRLFDGLFADPPAAYALAARESGSFDDPAVPGTQILDQTGAVIPYPPVPGYLKGDPLPDGQYWIHSEDPVVMPYLPDPLAHGVAFMSPDGASTLFGKAFSGAGWPDVQPFKLVLKEGPAGFDLSLDPAEVRVPRGERLEVNYASFVVPPDAGSPGELDLMGRWHSMTAAGRANTAAHGYQHWMLTPWRKLTFVHAVEKPIAPPVIVRLTYSRQAGQTFISLLRGVVNLHSPSTGELELRARYDDYLDDPLDAGGPQVLAQDAHVLDRPVVYGEEPVQIPAPPLVPGLPGGEAAPKHEFGDTKHRNVRYRMVGTTRYREYFPAKLWNYRDPVTKQKLITTEGPDFAEVNVLSSARPLPPGLLYIVPTFKWQDTPTGRRRYGGGLRLYLNRGWFSSGEGELLGLTMFPPGLNLDTALADRLRPYVSQWGEDPAWQRELTTALSPAQLTHDPAFPDTAPGPVRDAVLLAEESSLSVRVQGFKVHYDSQRRLWYVDVNFLPAHYYTFVRLGLCRFQPDSLSGLEISRVVRAEFAQLLGDRFATLTRSASAIDITLSGPSALSGLGVFLNQIGQPNFQPNSQPSVQNALASVPGAPGVGVVSQAQIIVDPGLTSNPAVGAGHRIVAQIEGRPLGVSGDLGWEPVDGGVRLASYTGLLFPGTVFWQGSVRWPRSDLPPNRQYRLVLREYELYETDQDVAESFAGASASLGRPVRGRVVYADIFPLDPQGPVLGTGG